MQHASVGNYHCGLPKKIALNGISERLIVYRFLPEYFKQPGLKTWLYIVYSIRLASVAFLSFPLGFLLMLLCWVFLKNIFYISLWPANPLYHQANSYFLLLHSGLLNLSKRRNCTTEIQGITNTINFVTLIHDKSDGFHQVIAYLVNSKQMSLCWTSLFPMNHMETNNTHKLSCFSGHRLFFDRLPNWRCVQRKACKIETIDSSDAGNLEQFKKCPKSLPVKGDKRRAF